MNIKILVSCHNNSDYIRNEIIRPIQVGCALSTARFEGMLRDNEGDNISSKNKEYCELTAQYWAWKNLDADYYGFFHYRRYLSFREVKQGYFFNIWRNIEVKSFGESEKSICGWNEKQMRNLIEKYDIIVPKQKDILKMPDIGRNMEEQYTSGTLVKKDLDIMRQVVSEKFPAFTPYVNEYLKGHTTFFNNMFIMKRDIFRDYCAWLFNILDECVKRSDYSDYTVEQRRTPGHLAERLLNIYCMYLRDKTDYKFFELDTVDILETNGEQGLKPAFHDDNTAIAFACNDGHVPYLAMVFLSAKKYFSKEKNYDLIVMHLNINVNSQRALQRIFEKDSNVSLRFADMTEYKNVLGKLYTRDHLATETYFRLLMPELLSGFDKVLYLDDDLIINRDLAKLYEMDLEDNLLGACFDVDMAGCYNGAARGRKKYIDNVLKIKDAYGYFQAGVLLFNLQKFREIMPCSRMINFAAKRKWLYLDQDTLNYLCQGKIKYIDMRWNVVNDCEGNRISWVISKAPANLYKLYMESRKEPWIIHYAGHEKPWNYPLTDWGEKFWEIARNSDFYEAILILSKPKAEKKHKKNIDNRIYNVIGGPIEKAEGFFYCVQDHGFKYTVKLMLKKISSKL